MKNHAQQTPSEKNTGTHILHIGLLLAAALILIKLSVPNGCLFGSETDWFCQHVTIADYMRKQFYATGDFLPDWSGLGSGSNFYDLSYYGFLRPDILISYFLPEVSMEVIIQAYAIGEIILGAWLLYLWLCRRGIGETFCLTASLLYLSSNCLFQAHRQIMFVNYLPFLIMAFLSIDMVTKGAEFQIQHRSWFPFHPGLVFSLFLILLHSFYFFPACFAACTLYFIFCMPKGARHLWKTYLASVTLSVSLAMILLLPTGLAILENKKDVKGTDFGTLLSINPSMNSLLYSAYGCGLTVLCLYTLLLSIMRKRTRGFAIVLGILFSFPLCYWILNGTLYARPKSLIPFMPLVLFLTAQTLDELSKGKLRHSLPPALFSIIPVLVQIVVLHSKYRSLLIADILALFGYVLTGILRQKAFRKHSGSGCIQHRRSVFSTPVCSLLLCIVPVLLYLETARTDTYVSASSASRETFSQKELPEACVSPYARMDILMSPMTNANYTSFGTQNKTTLYSSVSNSTYNHLYYDILKMPISIRNRVAMTGGSNPFQEYLLGVRYLQTTEAKLPAGYTVRLQNGEHILAENKQVLPPAYGSTSLLGESVFDSLSYPQNLDTLMNRTIVPEQQASQTYQSQMEAYELPEDLLNRSETDQEVTVTRSLLTAVKDSVLLLSFDINYHGKRDISVTINGIRNCLSGSTAPYPNRNTTFTYMLSQTTPIKNLEICFSKGKYEISNIQAYTLPCSAVSHPGLVPFTYEKTEGKELLHGTLHMEQDGYFVTSFAYSNGYQAYVDGQKVLPVRINKAFVGFPIKAGSHEVSISFRAPGKSAGWCISFLSLCYLLLGSFQSSPAAKPAIQVRRHKKLPNI